MLAIIEELLRAGYEISLWRHEMGSGFGQIVCNARKNANQAQGRAQRAEGAVAAMARDATANQLVVAALSRCDSVEDEEWNIVTRLVLELAGTVELRYEDDAFVIAAKFDCADTYPFVIPRRLRDEVWEMGAGGEVTWRHGDYDFILRLQASAVVVVAPKTFDVERKVSIANVDLLIAIHAAVQLVEFELCTWVGDIDNN